jgi:hypothetical protein
MMAITGASGTPINASLGQVTPTNTLFLRRRRSRHGSEDAARLRGSDQHPALHHATGFHEGAFDVGTSGPYNVETEVATQAVTTAGAAGLRTAFVSDSGARGVAFLIAIAAP